MQLEHAAHKMFKVYLRSMLLTLFILSWKAALQTKLFDWSDYIRD